MRCLPAFDDGSTERISNFKSNLAALEDIVESSVTPVLLMVDWNSDLKRGKKYDCVLNKFVKGNNLIDVVPNFYEKPFFTYKKGDYCTKIDHFFVKNELIKDINNSFVLEDILSNGSDHCPIICEFKSIRYFYRFNKARSDSIKLDNYHLKNVISGLVTGKSKPLNPCVVIAVKSRKSS
ncbi:hypothetical protein BpHYR1_004520 [Brachionus plicatilis]|uniref:RNA-directed DNA polymerase from mobile element jockey-like n=1 Tax=Brachionus plicatilis TaxID=10195 RepID=A0A3M7SJH9_BRAPC|nr:hypothetical protein BpHYR1_004520 [Brachionus plicatilis]